MIQPPDLVPVSEAVLHLCWQFSKLSYILKQFFLALCYVNPSQSVPMVPSSTITQVK